RLASTKSAPRPSNTRCLVLLRNSPQPRTRPPKPRIASCADLAIPYPPGRSDRPLGSVRPPPEGRNLYSSDHPIFLQHPANPFKGGAQNCLVMDDRQPDISLARVAPAIRRPRGIAARQHPDRRIAPQPQGCRLAVADLQPQKKPALRPVEPVAAGQRRFGDIEFAAVFGAVLLDMGLVAPQRGGGRLHRQGHL